MIKITKTSKTFIASLLLSIISLANTADAVKAPPGISNIKAQITTVGDGSSGVIGVVCSIATWWLFFAMLLSVIFGVWAGWKMIMEGSKGLNEQARHMLQYSLIGVAIGIIALGIPAIAGNFLGTEDVKGICPFL